MSHDTRSNHPIARHDQAPEAPQQVPSRFAGLATVTPDGDMGEGWPTLGPDTSLTDELEWRWCS